jgi:hypothetical protein
MSERLPYEQQLSQQWHDLPLPDENMAWADMKRRLEEDDDITPIAWWRRGCGLWALLLLVVMALGWWLFRPEKWLVGKNKKQESSLQPSIDSTKKESNNRNEITIEQNDNDNTTDGNKITGTSQGTNDKNPVEKPSTTINERIVVPGRESTGADVCLNVKPSRPRKKKSDQPGARIPGNNIPATIIDKPGNNEEDKINPSVPITTDTAFVKRDTPRPVKPVTMIADTAIVKTIVSDTAKKTTTPDAPVSSKNPKQDSAKQKFTFFSAGIAINQQLPVAGQTATPYNSLGRKGTLLDYIPSIYFRYNKRVNTRDKWFIQSEFRYGAPQYTRKLIYDQKTVPDPGTNSPFANVTSSVVKKTYYHQLPITFNYFVAPNWSVGGGIAWNRFSSAIVEKEIARRNIITQIDSFTVMTGNERLPDSTASKLFAKSFFQAVVETQFRWKRFSLGARYAFGLDPYIKFTLPGGTQQEERNSSLQIFLRYELWKSRLRAQKR